MREQRTLGSVRGAASNGRPYRDSLGFAPADVGYGTRMQDGRTRLAYKLEHAADLDMEAIVAAAIHPADRGDTTTLGGHAGGGSTVPH